MIQAAVYNLINPTKMANHRQGLAQQKKRIRYRSGSNFNAEYTRTFDWVMASDRGKQQATARFAVSISASLTAGLTTSVDMGKAKGI